MGGHLIVTEIGCRVNKYFVNRIYQDILRSDVFEINPVNLSGDLFVVEHPWWRNQIRDLQGRIRCQGVCIIGWRRKRRLAVLIHSFMISDCITQPGRIDLLDLLNHLKEPCPAWDAIGFQGWGYGQTNGLFCARRVCHHQVGGQRI